MKIKKLLHLSLVLGLMFLCAQEAFAVTYTVTSREEYSDVLGNTKKRVTGTIALDSDYPCNTTTGRCGEEILPSQIGLSTIEQLRVESQIVNPASGTGGSGLFLFKYHSSSLSGAGNVIGTIRAYYQNGEAITRGFASAPTYDLSALSSVPFEAIGS